MQIPRANQVDHSIRKVAEAARSALQNLNEKAGGLMARGRYSEAEALAHKGREIQAFLEKVTALGEDWKEVKGTGKPHKQEITPLWAYYQPILRALVELDGDARRPDLEPLVFESMRSTFKPGDTQPIAAGERWQEMIRRCRQALIQEGWLKNDPGGKWVITEAGRRAASAKNKVKASGSRN